VSFDAYVYVERWSIVDRPMALLVQLQMANRADKDTGVIEVSLAALAEDCRFQSPSAVDRHLRHLVAIGEVEVLDPGRRGRGHRARYRFPRMAAPPTAEERQAAAKRPPPRGFIDATTVSDDNGKTLAGGVFAGEQADGKDLEKPSKNPRSGGPIGKPLPSPSSLTGGTSTHPEGGGRRTTAAAGRERKAPRPGRPPRTPRHRSDPFVVDRARDIRAMQGPAAAEAYLRAVDARYGQANAADQTARLGDLIARYGPDLEGWQP
jgi:hypothetical protein